MDDPSRTAPPWCSDEAFRAYCSAVGCDHGPRDDAEPDWSEIVVTDDRWVEDEGRFRPEGPHQSGQGCAFAFALLWCVAIVVVACRRQIFAY